METYSLLSLAAFIGLSTSYSIALITRRPENVVNGLTIEKESFTQKEGSAKVFIPNTLARWPWPRRINIHHTEVTKESDIWMESLNALNPKGQYAFNRCNHSHLASLAYPHAKREHFRACCDFMNMAFFIDEYSDASEAFEVQKQKYIIMDALRNPHKPRPEGEWIGGEMARQFWERTIRNASTQSQMRFIIAFDEYLEGVLQQAIDRSTRRVRDIKSYIEIRRNTIAMKPAFALLELGLDIPDEVMSHPSIQEMVLAAVDMVCVSNDITSYNVEQSRGDDSHNIVRIVMNEFGTNANGAMLWAQDFHTQLEQRFHATMAALPEWDELLNSQVKEYCDGLGQWVRGYDDWQFESERYLGNRGPEIKEKRWMSLMPKRCETGTEPHVGPVLVDGSLL